MIQNPSHYDISSAAYTYTMVDNRIHTFSYAELIKSVTTNGSYSELIHIYALSAAVSLAISSFCPAYCNVMTQMHPYSVHIYGRSVPRKTEPYIQLLWMMACFPENVRDFRPNHIVYLASTSLIDRSVTPITNKQPILQLEKVYEAEDIARNVTITRVRSSPVQQNKSFRNFW